MLVRAVMSWCGCHIVPKSINPGTKYWLLNVFDSPAFSRLWGHKGSLCVIGWIQNNPELFFEELYSNTSFVFVQRASIIASHESSWSCSSTDWLCVHASTLPWSRTSVGFYHCGVKKLTFNCSLWYPNMYVTSAVNYRSPCYSSSLTCHLVELLTNTSSDSNNLKTVCEQCSGFWCSTGLMAVSHTETDMAFGRVVTRGAVPFCHCSRSPIDSPQSHPIH